MANYYDDGETRKPWDHVHQARQCVASDLFKVADDAPPELVESIDAYLAPFAAPIRNDRKNKDCLHCGEELTGMWAGMIGRGGFTWGLAHGEGHCAACHWPARAYHVIKDGDGKQIASIRPFVLQYLPDFEAERKAREEVAA